jgi:polysaccharide export outer membrane protein
MEEPRRMGRRRRGTGGAICATLFVLAGCAAKHPIAPDYPTRTPADTALPAAVLTPAGAPLPVAAPSPAPYHIGANDTLEIIVWREDKISGPVQVRPDGMITVALIGDVPAAGLTPEALSENIRTGLSRFIDSPNVVVRVAATGSRRYFIVGNVKAPGAYDLRADQTFLQALSVAGGFTDFASRGSVRIIRQSGGPLPARIDYNAVVSGDAPDVRLEPNDTIVVP